MNRDSIHHGLCRRDQEVSFIKQLDERHNVQNTATNRSWNGQAFECSLCRKQYRQLDHLNQHLRSPAHDQKYCHCPNGRCKKEFSTLAALFNHLGSECCGFMGFEKVQEIVGQFLAGGKLISFNWSWQIPNKGVIDIHNLYLIVVLIYSLHSVSRAYYLRHFRSIGLRWEPWKMKKTNNWIIECFGNSGMRTKAIGLEVCGF